MQGSFLPWDCLRLGTTDAKTDSNWHMFPL